MKVTHGIKKLYHISSDRAKKKQPRVLKEAAFHSEQVSDFFLGASLGGFCHRRVGRYVLW